MSGDLGAVKRLISADHGLAVVSTVRGDGTVQSSVVNAGVCPHPVSGEPVIGLVAMSAAVKLANLRARPRATVAFRAGWEWMAVEGAAELIGPDDPYPGFETAGLPQLLRDVFVAAGGTHDDWATYDRVMAEERRTAVFVRPERTYGRVS
ncbi:MAG: TIGR03618 family F420-dependent PPOX class oxidoreductase [Acidimicrobiia bacterium]